MDKWAWTLVDPIAMSDRPNLIASDACFYFMTHDSRGYMASRANDLMNDFKKDIEQYAERPDVLAYKKEAIRRCARYVASFFEEREGYFDGLPVSLVPMPTSVPKRTKGWDYRLDALCKLVSDEVPWVRYEPVLDIKERITPSHAGGTRDVETLEKMIKVTGPISSAPSGGWVVLFDDILTTGAHYAACRNLLSKKYGPMCNYSLIGLFLALHVWI